MNTKVVAILIVGILFVIVIAFSFSGLLTTPENINVSNNGSVDGKFSVDNNGGWVVPTDCAASLYFPEGAVLEKTDITIKSTEDLPDEDGVVSDLGFEFGPDGIEFDAPADLNIDYSGVELPEGVEESLLRIYKIEDEAIMFGLTNKIEELLKKDTKDVR